MTGLEADTDTVTDGAVRNVVGTPRGVMDVDSHEMIPVELWGEYFSESLHAQVQRARFDIFARQRANPMSAPDISEDATEITYDTVWNLKGIRAPSAIDMDRRPDVLDAMGIRRQLVFPTMGLFALVLRNATNSHEWLGYDPAQVDARALGLEAIEAHNAWAARVTLASGDRVRPAAIVVTDSLDTMVQGAENALAAGVRAFMLPANTPPAGTSPADPELDPFWRLLADAKAPAILHLGTDFGLLASSAWSHNVEVFHPSDKSSIELPVEPYRSSIIGLAPENYISTLVLGGVFERHPTLRVGALEFGAGWIGPLAERLDCWGERQFASRLRGVLSMRPSSYLAQNVRLSPFYFEPVSMYLDRHADISACFCYSSDFPHVEGGKDSLSTLAALLEGAPSEVRDGFFVSNADLLLPD